MKYKRFEDLPVWQAGMTLTEKVFTITADKAFAFQGDLANQLQRAALSVCNNIAEGFERGTTNELLTFLYYSRGSAGEVRSMLLLMDRLGRFKHPKSEISDLKSLAESISRQLRAWADTLQNSPIKGQRYLNEQVREKDQGATRRKAFESQLQRIVEEGQATKNTPPPGSSQSTG
ncbi:MAG: four helix bundle protein [Planctomycetaceae bacterium]|nr:four helix bundle protein [Planctomycetaceae bacterium]